MPKYLFLLQFIICLFITTPTYAQTKVEFANVIDLAGRQRMLSQKMAFETLLVLLKVDGDTSKRDATISLFETSLKSLIEGDAAKKIPQAPSEKLKTQLIKISELFTEYKMSLTDLDVGKIAIQSQQVLRESNAAVRMYVALAKKAKVETAGNVINTAGRQRMLTQKMAMEACFVHLGHSPKRFLKSLEATKKLFQHSMDALIDGSERMKIPAAIDPSVKEQLMKVSELWEEYSKTLDAVSKKDGGDSTALTMLATRSSIILKEMNAAVTLFKQVETITTTP